MQKNIALTADFIVSLTIKEYYHDPERNCQKNYQVSESGESGTFNRVAPGERFRINVDVAERG
jgi:hypothetical protein